MRQTILTILLILLLAATGFLWVYYRPRPVAPGPRAATQPELTRYRELRNLAPDLSLFSEPTFKALRAISLPPGAPPALGVRQNPFTPLP